MTVIVHRPYDSGRRDLRSAFVPRRSFRLLLAALIASVALGVVAMHQLSTGHGEHVGSAPGAAAPSHGPVKVHGVDQSHSVSPNSAGTTMVGVLTSGCLLALALIVLRPARPSAASYPVPGGGSADDPSPTGARELRRARSPSRFQLAVCRT